MNIYSPAQFGRSDNSKNVILEKSLRGVADKDDRLELFTISADVYTCFLPAILPLIC